jgi:hypothetical protein
MKDETVQAVLECIERVLPQMGIPTLEDAGVAIQRLAHILNQITPFCNRERLKEELVKIEVSAADDILIRAATENFPALAVALFEEALPLMRKEFPVINAGRPKSLTSEQERAVCEYVGQLYAEGLEIKIAKQRAAQKFHVSASTINRTWAGRKKGHKPSIKEVIEILKAKQTDSKKALSAGGKGSDSGENKL